MNLFNIRIENELEKKMIKLKKKDKILYAALYKKFSSLWKILISANH